MPSLIPSQGKPQLELRGIRKVYSSVVANDIDLVVAPGEIQAILGENGARIHADENHLRGDYSNRRRDLLAKRARADGQPRPGSCTLGMVFSIFSCSRHSPSCRTWPSPCRVAPTWLTCVSAFMRSASAMACPQTRCGWCTPLRRRAPARGNHPLPASKSKATHHG
jgi:hypothetical protein